MKRIDTVVAAGAWLLLTTAPVAAATQAALPPMSPLAAAVIPRPHELYNTADYTLAFHVFLNDHKVADACGIAVAAVRARPHNLLWRRRLARTALWLGHQRLALRELSYLALHGDAAALKPSIALASGLSAFTRLTTLLALKLRTAPNRHLIIAMSGIYQLQGHPRRAIALLQWALRTRPRRRYLWEIAVLYQTLGENRREMAVLKRYERRYGPSARDLLAQASLLYLAGHTGAAYHLLYRYRHDIAGHNFAYWHTLGALAWLYQNFPVARQASGILYQEGLATRADLVHLVLLSKRRHPRTAFVMAETGLRRYKRPFFFFAMLSIAEQQGSRRLLIKTFATVTPAERRILMANPYYWTGYARYFALQGENARAERAYRAALTKFPDDDAIMASYLWFLVDTGHARELARVLPRWAPWVDHDRTLWTPYGLSYLALNNPRLARPYFFALLRRAPGDPSLLLACADTLRKEGRTGEAIQLERRAWNIIATHPRLQAARNVLRERARLAYDLAIAPRTVPLMQALGTHSQSGGRSAILSYALTHSAYPLARLWLLTYPAHDHHPPWARLTVALAYHNATAIAHLLATDSDVLPRTDRVTAARRIGEQSRAQSMAFNSLSESREDWPLVRQDRRLLLAGADNIAGRFQVLRSSGFAAIMSRVRSRYFLTADFMIAVEANNNSQRVTDPSLIAMVPASDRSTQVTLATQQTSGHYALNIGERTALTHFLYGEIAYGTRLSADTRMQVTGRWNERAYDLPSLYIGGTRSGFTVRTESAWTPRDATSARLAYRRLAAQGGGFLADGEIGALDYAHKIDLDYPDFTIGGGVEVTRYQGTTILPPQLLPLVPNGESGLGFFVPQSFVQGSLDFRFGTRYLRHYAPDLRPFADLDVFENSVTHAGYDLTVGVALPVFGPDHLAFYYYRGQGGVGINNRTQYVGMRYTYLFKP